MLNKKNTWIFVLFLCPTGVYSLQAPYLVDVTARSSGSCGLIWRNNSSAYDSMYILRKEVAGIDFIRVCAISGNVASFVDTNLAPSQLYRYALLARSASEVSDTSNTDSATTLPPEFTFYGQLMVTWDAAKFVAKLVFKDRLCTGKQVKIYRTEYSGTPVLLCDTAMSNASTGDSCQIILSDAPPVNRWYFYTIIERIDNDSYTVADTLFALCKNTFFRQDSAIYLNRVLSEYPLYADTKTLWTAMAGDSIFIKENNTADSLYTVINVANKGMPVFKGYRLYKKPCSTPNGCKVYNNHLFYGGTIYRIAKGGPVVENSCFSYLGSWEFFDFFNDTLAILSHPLSTDFSPIVTTNHEASIEKVLNVPFSFNNTCNGAAGHSSCSYTYGPYRNFIWRERSGGTTNGSSSYSSVDFVQVIPKDTILQCTIDSCRVGAPPRLYGGYPSQDSSFIKSAISFLDTVNHRAYLIRYDRLIVGEYSIGQYVAVDTRRCFGTSTQATSAGFRLLKEGNRLVVDFVDNTPGIVAMYDGKGRMLLRKNKGYEKKSYLPLAMLPGGVYIIAIQSGSGDSRAATFFKQ